MENSAVDWFNNSIFELQLQIERKEISLGEFAVKRVEIFEQAKIMEKQQIIEAHAVGRIKECSGINTDGEQYYNETFKK